jgi:hypothetical protein
MPADERIVFDLNGIEQWQAAVEGTAKRAIREWMV